MDTIKITCPECGHKIELKAASVSIVAILNEYLKTEGKAQLDALGIAPEDAVLVFGGDGMPAVYFNTGKSLLPVDFSFSEGIMSAVAVMTTLSMSDDDSSDDDAEEIIRNGRTIQNNGLFRRHIAAQALRIIDSYITPRAYLRNRGYSWMWTMLKHEYEAQAKMERNKDFESLGERQLFFTEDVLREATEDFFHQCRKSLKGRTVNRDGMVIWNGQESNPVDLAALFKDEAQHIGEREQLDKLSRRVFVSAADEKNFQIPACVVDAFMGAGAYFTMKNLTLFSGMGIVNDEGDVLEPGQESLGYLQDRLAGRRPYQLWGILKSSLNANGMDIRTLSEKWYKEKTGAE